MDSVRKIPFLACVEFSRCVCSAGEFEFARESRCCVQNPVRRGYGLRRAGGRGSWASTYPLGMESGRGAIDRAAVV